MKQLQNNFTTPEQSDRLLELGVPANSADCYRTNKYERRIRQYAPETSSDFFTNHPHQTPCWSVGRLIEIYTICCPTDVLQEFLDELNCVEGQVYAMVKTFEIAHENSVLDFSLLEE